MQNVEQRSFAGGELSPDIYGRADTQKYATGVKTCRNFFIKRSGSLSNRSGFGFVCEVSDSSKAVRLLEFQFNSDQTYILEFGDLYMRVIQNGVLLESSPGVPYEIVTPYAEADLFDLKYDQSADVITITHPSYQARQLSRTGHTSWTIAAITFAPVIDAPASPAASGNAGSNSYSYKITAVESETYIESEGSAAADSPSTAVPTSINPITVTWTAVTGAVEYRIYKALNGVYGYIGTAQGTSFDDTNLAADISTTPPIANDPFSGTGNYPSTCGYFQQRHYFGNTNTDPTKIWATRTGDLKNMSLRSPLQVDDAFSFKTVGLRVNEIRHLLDVGKLVILTSGGEIVAMGDQAGAVNATSINLTQQGYNGASNVRPVIIGNSIIFVQARGTIIRDLRYAIQDDGYTGNDLTVFSSHLFDGHSVVDFAYQQIPNSIVWAVRDDGTLLGLTYVREHQIWGWHRHDTINGLFESIAVVSEGQEDVLYAVVKRTIDGSTVRYIERMASRFVSDMTTDALFMDSYLSYDGTNDTSTTMTLSGGSTWSYDEVLTLTSSAGYFTSGDVGNAIFLTSGTDEVRCKITAYTSTTIVSVTPNKTVPSSLQSTAVTTWQKAVDELTGLDHLEGETVNILADGVVQAQLVVIGGSITLEQPSSIVHVGLPITADLITMDIDQPDGNVIGNRKKVINRMSIHVVESKGVFAGPDVDHLTENKVVPDSDPTTGRFEISIRGRVTDDGSIFIRQSDPLPLTVIGIIASGYVGD